MHADIGSIQTYACGGINEVYAQLIDTIIMNGLHVCTRKRDIVYEVLIAWLCAGALLFDRAMPGNVNRL